MIPFDNFINLIIDNLSILLIS